MEKFLCFSLLVFAALFISASGAAHAAVLAYESFDTLTNDSGVDGFGDTASVGLSGTWTVNINNGATVKSRTIDAKWDGAESNLATYGIGYPVRNSNGCYNFIEKDSWNVEQAVAPLATPIDMTGNGTWYMSFVSSAKDADYAAQMGLNDGTNELMLGNGYKANGTTQGLAARYDLMSNYTTGGSLAGSSNISPTIDGEWDVLLYVAKLDNVIGTGMNVSLYAYDLNTITSAPSVSDTPLWTTSVSSPTSAFTNFEFDLSGGSSRYPGIGKLCVGTTLADVTTAVPEPSTVFMLVIGMMGIAIYARRK
jgi:hypothetical protein